MNKAMLVLTLVLVACGGISEEDFGAQYGDLICDKTFECTDEAVIGYLPWASAEECKNFEATGTATGTTTGTGTCAFDAANAALCLEEYEALTCDEFTGGSFPASCAAICG